MSEEQTIVISTHQVRDIDSLLDHIIIMDNSQVFLNASVAEITQQLAFEFRPMGASVDDALYAQPSLQGVAVVVPNDGTKDTPIKMRRTCVASAKLIKAFLRCPMESWSRRKSSVSSKSDKHCCNTS